MTFQWLRTVSAVGIAGALACAADLDRPPSAADAGGAAPVLRPSEPVETVVFTLPGLPAPPPRVLKPFTEPLPVPVEENPVLPAVPDPARPAPVLSAPLPAPDRAPLKSFTPAPSPAEVVPVLPEMPPVATDPALPVDGQPVPKRATKTWFPPDFERDSAAYCQQRIGQWSQPDAYNLLGLALRQRPAAGDNGEVVGKIYAFSDPTGRYREIELDFAADTGLLRTVFVYPKTLTWSEARRMWGADVSSTEANKGRIFYSYTNRHLDVLVGPDGRVISLGLY